MTVKFYLAPSKVKDKEVAIVAVITRSRKERFWITLDEKVFPKHWDYRTQRVKVSDTEQEAKNDYLDDFRKHATTLHRNNRDKSIAELKALVRGVAVVRDEKKTLQSALNLFIQQWREDKDELTVKKYEALRGHLFGCESRKGRAIVGYIAVHGALDFANLDWNFYDRFRSFLYSKGMVDSSVYKYISNLKTFLRWAKKRNYPVDPSFENWKIIQRTKRVVSLTLDELETLENSKKLIGGLAIGRDYLCFEARTGQRISDILRFDKKDFNEETKEWTFRVRKGRNIKGKEQTIPFVGFIAPALDILERHHFSMPKVAAKSINEWIKQAARAVGITQPVEIEVWKRNKCTFQTVEKCELLSTHNGRKTFVTLSLQNGVDPKIVKDLAGIDSWQTLKHYEGRSERTVQRKALVDMEAKLKAG